MRNYFRKGAQRPSIYRPDTPVALNGSSKIWETCNRCGYPFKKKENGEIDGRDVVEHKQSTCALRGSVN